MAHAAAAVRKSGCLPARQPQAGYSDAIAWHCGVNAGRLQADFRDLNSVDSGSVLLSARTVWIAAQHGTGFRCAHSQRWRNGPSISLESTGDSIVTCEPGRSGVNPGIQA